MFLLLSVVLCMHTSVHALHRGAAPCIFAHMAEHSLYCLSDVLASWGQIPTLFWAKELDAHVMSRTDSSNAGTAVHHLISAMTNALCIVILTLDLEQPAREAHI